MQPQEACLIYELKANQEYKEFIVPKSDFSIKHLIDAAKMISDAVDRSRWCAQDPVCNSAKSDDELRTSGACHHCVLVPETSCEIFNKEVDRALIVGSSERGIKGAFE